ncbi:ATP-dependent DNA helicase [Luteococcus sp. OSA5]|uniref:ATP-dependent DNA helicase n=1 Tax=Luteococcus sp. OSA5 TaxID=3401630 RepID=UPI003B42F6F0
MPEAQQRPASDVTSEDVLQAAVAAIGGTPREGQQQMAAAIEQAIDTGEHLLVQAGTGTGKSLGYLAPALLHVQGTKQRIVVATATLALQAQLANTDIPNALKAVREVTGREPGHAILKGRTNYACLLKTRDGVVNDQDTLLGGADLTTDLKQGSADAESVLGAEVVMLREWAEEELASGGLADRDDAPSHSPRAWGLVSMPVRECLGAQRCPHGQECFVEASREKARAAQLVVTNHALLAIDAMHGGTALPEHEIVIIDEAHELVGRVTGAASAELGPQLVERVAKRTLPWLSDELGLEFLESADMLRVALDDVEPGRITQPGSATTAFETIRDVSRRVVSGLGGKSGDKSRKDVDPEQQQAQSAAKEVFDIAERMAELSSNDVVWVSESDRFGRQAQVAPLSVAGLMRERVLGESTTIMTSATLKIGGDFNQVAGQIGLRKADRLEGEGHDPDNPLAWRALDVGTPFTYSRQGILYCATSLPNPRREGITQEALAEIAELVWAAGGRTLGLFASQKAAEVAAAHVRKQLPKMTILCQGDAQLSDLTRRFIAEPEVCLFGTVSLWQGIDVPGETCELVIIDKIPFPRPDDPLMQARQQAVAEAGGNGFMAVAATHAGLLMAQGSGRLIRRVTDRGVVAVLDPRLVKARYGGFLRASMPDFWMTKDREVAVQALRRLQEAK